MTPREWLILARVKELADKRMVVLRLIAAENGVMNRGTDVPGHTQEMSHDDDGQAADHDRSV